MEGMRVEVFVEEACDGHFSGLSNLGILLSLDSDYHVCFSLAMIAAFSQTFLLQAGGKIPSHHS